MAMNNKVDTYHSLILSTLFNNTMSMVVIWVGNNIAQRHKLGKGANTELEQNDGRGTSEANLRLITMVAAIWNQQFNHAIMTIL